MRTLVNRIRATMTTSSRTSESGSPTSVSCRNFKMQLYKPSQKHYISILWKALEASVTPQFVSCKWEWVSTWLATYGDQVDYWFVVAFHTDIPVGITLLTREKNRKLPLPVKAFYIGTAGESYKDQIRMVPNGLLVVSEFKEYFLKEIIEMITSEFEWEEIVFQNYTTEDGKLLMNNPHRKHIKSDIKTETCRFFDLTTVREANTTILNSLSHDTRYSIRRSIKAFGNDLEIEWAQDARSAHEILDELGHLFQATWTKQNQRGIFASAKYKEFHQEIIKKMIHENSLILFRVKSKQYGTLGCLYLFINDGIAYGYQLGLNRFENIEIAGINKKRLRTGFILHALCMEECLKRGLKAYNFSTGDYPYKAELTNNMTEVMTVSIRKNVKPLLREQLVELYSKIDSHKTTARLFSPLRLLI